MDGAMVDAGWSHKVFQWMVHWWVLGHIIQKKRVLFFLQMGSMCWYVFVPLLLLLLLNNVIHPQQQQP